MHVDWAASQRLCLQNPGNCEQSCPRQGRFNNLLFTTAHSIKQTNTVNQVFIWTKGGKEKTGMYMNGQGRQVCLSRNAGGDSLPQLRAECLPRRAPRPPQAPPRCWATAWSPLPMPSHPGSGVKAGVVKKKQTHISQGYWYFSFLPVDDITRVPTLSLILIFSHPAHKDRSGGFWSLMQMPSPSTWLHNWLFNSVALF